jgi:hypothetical protein
MAIITKEFIDSVQIPTPSGLNELLDKILKDSKLRHDVDFMPDKAVPCLIYKEWIAQIGPPLYLPEKKIIITRTNHDGIQGSLTHSISRDVLNLSSGGMNDLNRGKILVAFCDIEFIVDLLICYSLGVYSEKCSYEDVYKNCFKPGGSLSNFENKKKFLRLKKVLPDDLFKELSEVQTVRNKVAHNYFLDKNMGLSDKTVSQYKSVDVAIETKYNYAWILLLQVYNEYQVEIVKWAYGDTLDASLKI